MLKKHWANEMTAVAVNEMTGWLKELIAARSRGNGDRENAMRRVEQEFGIGFWQQWGLLYRGRSRPDVELYQRIRGAFLSTLEKSVRRDLARLETEAAKSNDDPDLASLQAEARDILAKIKAKLETKIIGGT